MKRLEKQWDEGQLVTLDVLDPQIRDFADQVGFEVTPTFILFDGQGNEVRRWVGRVPDAGELDPAAGK